MLQALVFTDLNSQLISIPLSRIEALEADLRKRAVLRITGGATIVVKEPFDIVRLALRCARPQ
jgi:hypothetical protein